jgi:hypothetical protein
MDNRFISQIKRSLKVLSSYSMTLILLIVFIMPILGLAKDNTPTVMVYISFLLFLLLFLSLYTEMRDIAIKEKRPQYEINPPPFKGFVYGIMGAIPLVLIQTVAVLIVVPEDIKTLIRKLYQGINGPLYWFSKLIGNAPVHYIVSYILVVVIAGIGYFAGHNNFYIVAFIKQKLGIKTKPKKRVVNQKRR